MLIAHSYIVYRMVGNFCRVLMFFSWFTKINAGTMICVEGGHTGGVTKHRGRPAAIPSNELSVCRHCCPVDAAFNPRDSEKHGKAWVRGLVKYVYLPLYDACMQKLRSDADA